MLKDELKIVEKDFGKLCTNSEDAVKKIIDSKEREIKGS